MNTNQSFSNLILNLIEFRHPTQQHNTTGGSQGNKESFRGISWQTEIKFLITFRFLINMIRTTLDWFKNIAFLSKDILFVFSFRFR